MGKKVEDITTDEVRDVGPSTTISMSRSSGASLYRLALKELEKIAKTIAKNKELLEATHILTSDYERIQNKVQSLEGKHTHLARLIDELKKGLM